MMIAMALGASALLFVPLAVFAKEGSHRTGAGEKRGQRRGDEIPGIS